MLILFCCPYFPYAASSLCFAEKTIYTQEVLAVVLHQLMEMNPLPTLFMRTVIFLYLFSKYSRTRDKSFYLAVWPRDAVPLKNPPFTLARHRVSSSFSCQSIRLDHGGSWAQIPSGTRIFVYEFSYHFIFLIVAHLSQKSIYLVTFSFAGDPVSQHMSSTGWLCHEHSC